MYQHLECIALRTVKVSDSKSLLSAWTRQLGRVSFSIPAGAGREARRRRALCSPAKSIIAIFLSGVLDLLLRRSEPDEALSDFLFSSIEAFAAITDNSCTASFHIIFLYHLTLYAGIGPDADTYIPGCVFDLREGMFRTTAPLHPDFIAGEECSYFASLASARYDTPLHIPAPIRRHLLDFLLTYYSLHLMSFSSLKSLEILRDMA